MTTGIFALIECLRPGGMWTNVPATASFNVIAQEWLHVDYSAHPNVEFLEVPGR